jgi:RNA polymerase sigma-70 factor (ECF subfamily)
MGHDGGNQRQPAEREGFDDLLMRLDPLILSVVGRFARDPDVADDLAQACRIRIHEKRGQCRDPAAVFGWAKSLCRHVCINAVGTERRDRDCFVEDMDGTASAETSVPDPLAAIETKELRLRVRTAVERLPAEQRRLLALRYWHGLSAVDIARRLHLPDATVRTRLRRARLRLRRAPEIVCYAPRLPSLWSQKSGNGMMDEAQTSARPASDGMGAPTQAMR